MSGGWSHVRPGLLERPQPGNVTRNEVAKPHRWAALANCDKHVIRLMCWTSISSQIACFWLRFVTCVEVAFAFFRPPARHSVKSRGRGSIL